MFNTHNQIRLKVYDQSGSSVTRFGAILTLCQFLKVLGKFARIYLVLGIAKYWIYFGFFSCYWANFHCCKCSKIELVNNRAIWLGCLHHKKPVEKREHNLRLSDCVLLCSDVVTDQMGRPVGTYPVEKASNLTSRRSVFGSEGISGLS